MAKRVLRDPKELVARHCAARWPGRHWRAFRHHVEIGEFSGETLKSHLEECFPGKENEKERQAEIRSVKGILAIYGIHPDVLARKRKASQIWLAAHKKRKLEEFLDCWEKKTDCRLMDLYETELEKVKHGAGSMERGTKTENV